MGDAGVFGVGRGNSGAGIRTVRYKIPTAGEEVWDDVDTDDNGVVGTGNANTFGYEVSVMGFTASASLGKEEIGTDSSLVLVADDLRIMLMYREVTKLTVYVIEATSPK